MTPFGTFQFNFKPLGLKNAGATFQRLLDQILGDLDFVFIYLDDILISLGIEKEHSKHFCKMFSCLQKACLTINLPKYEFFATKLEFLSHVVNTS